MDADPTVDTRPHDERPLYTVPHSFRLPEETSSKLKEIAEKIAPPGKKANTTVAIKTAIDNAHAEISAGTLGVLASEFNTRLLVRVIRHVLINDRAANDDPLDDGDRFDLYDLLYKQLIEPAKRWQQERAVISAMEADQKSPSNEEEWVARRRRANTARKIVENEYPLLPESVIEAYEKGMFELGCWPPSRKSEF